MKPRKTDLTQNKAKCERAKLQTSVRPRGMYQLPLWTAGHTVPREQPPASLWDPSNHVVFDSPHTVSEGRGNHWAILVCFCGLHRYRTTPVSTWLQAVAAVMDTVSALSLFTGWEKIFHFIHHLQLAAAILKKTSGLYRVNEQEKHIWWAC